MDRVVIGVELGGTNTRTALVNRGGTVGLTSGKRRPAKQLNILLGQLGVKDTQIRVDPTTGGLGYGMEYSYSVIERDRMPALTQEDEKLQLPIVNYLGQEVWKVKECKLTNAEAPQLGEQATRGILMEAVTAVCLLLAGSDLLIMRHPEAVKLVKNYIQELAG